MKVILDEMHAPQIADALAATLDVVAVAATPELKGISDEELLTHATSDERAVVTENVADFMPLARQWASEGWPHSGLIFTNPKRFNRANLAYPGNLIAALEEFLEGPPVKGESWIRWL